jgi:hypothetical protein
MAANKRSTIRYELAGDDSPCLSPANPTPPYPCLRKASSTGDLAHAIEMPADLPSAGSSSYTLANFIENDVKIRRTLPI